MPRAAGARPVWPQPFLPGGAVVVHVTMEMVGPLCTETVDP